MKCLLDTHVLIWWWSSPERLSAEALATIQSDESEVYVSAASAWEIATKHRIGKLPTGAAMLAGWRQRLAADRFHELPISARHATTAGLLAGEHRDPFDRMIAAQGIDESTAVITADEAIASLGAKTLW